MDKRPARPRYPTVIGVIGGGQCTAEEAELAGQVGEELARRGAIIICGGQGGVMEAACRGASRKGRLDRSIIVARDPKEAVALALTAAGIREN